MVELSLALMEQGSTLARGREETLDHFLARLSHLAQPSRGLTSFGRVVCCANLRVLTLYDNAITTWPESFACPLLERLYLQGNALSTIGDALDQLPRLVYLDLSQNEIRHVDGMHGCERLETLKLDHQRLYPSQEACETKGAETGPGALTFDPEAMAGLKHLTLLSVVGNGLSGLDTLAAMPSLQQLDARDNAIVDVEGLAHVLAGWPALTSLHLGGSNPVSKDLKFREHVLLATGPNLSLLNDKPVHANERRFLEGMAEMRRRRDSGRARPVASALGPGGGRGDKQQQRQAEDDPRTLPQVRPHMPPFASQYRDLLLQQMQQSARDA